MRKLGVALLPQGRARPLPGRRPAHLLAARLLRPHGRPRPAVPDSAGSLSRVFDYPDPFGAQLGLSVSHAEIVVEVYPDHLVTIGALEGGVQYHWFDYSYINGHGIPTFF